MIKQMNHHQPNGHDDLNKVHQISISKYTVSFVAKNVKVLIKRIQVDFAHTVAVVLLTEENH